MAERLMGRDWGATIGAFGLMLITGVLTLCALLVVAACVFFLVTEGILGYVLLGLVALGFGCLFGSGTVWCYSRMVEG